MMECFIHTWNKYVKNYFVIINRNS